ncbi:MAG: LPS assembly lipoprotein LptE [bacterium]
MRYLLLSAAALILSGLCCCGYSTHALMRSDLQRVAMLPVDNGTSQPGIGDEMTELLVSAFNDDRRLRVTSLDAADLSVNARLTSYARSPVAYSGDEIITAYEIVVSATVICEDRTRNEEYYSGSLSARVSYEPDSEPEESAATRCLATLADDIVRAIVTKW